MSILADATMLKRIQKALEENDEQFLAQFEDLDFSGPEAYLDEEESEELLEELNFDEVANG